MDAVLDLPVQGEGSFQAEEAPREEVLPEVAVQGESSDAKCKMEDRLHDPEGVFEDGGEEDGESNAASDESFDSAVERMETSSPRVGSFKAQQGALKQLNEWHSGESSLDSSLLDHFNEEEFKEFVVNIAAGRSYFAHDEVVRNVLDSLLPVVRERNILLNLARENGAFQGSQKPKFSSGRITEVDLSEAAANGLVGDLENEDLGYTYGHHEDGKLVNLQKEYNGNFLVESPSDRVKPQPTGTDLTCALVFSDRGAHHHKSNLPENEANTFPEDEDSKNVEAETIKAKPEFRLEDEHTDTGDPYQREVHVQKLGSDAERDKGEDDKGTEDHVQKLGSDAKRDNGEDEKVAPDDIGIGLQSERMEPKAVDVDLNSTAVLLDQAAGRSDDNSLLLVGEEAAHNSSAEGVSFPELPGREAETSDADIRQTVEEESIKAEPEVRMKDIHVDGRNRNLIEELNLKSGVSKFNGEDEKGAGVVLVCPSETLQQQTRRVETNAEASSFVEQATDDVMVAPDAGAVLITDCDDSEDLPSEDRATSCDSEQIEGGKRAMLHGSDNRPALNLCNQELEALTGETSSKDVGGDSDEFFPSTKSSDFQRSHQHPAPAVELETEIKAPEAEADGEVVTSVDVQFDSCFDGNDKVEASSSGLAINKPAAFLSEEGSQKILLARERDGVFPFTEDVKKVTVSTERGGDVVDKNDGNTENISDSVHSESSVGPVDTPLLGGAGPGLPGQPEGLGRSVPTLEHAPRATQVRGNGVSVSRPAAPLERTQRNNEANDSNEETREKLQMIRVKFLRLAHRLGQNAHNVVVAQVLYRLGLAEQLRGGRTTNGTGAFSFERASVIAEEQEAVGEEQLDFSCTIMLLGKTGVGKSATINSIFGEVKSEVDAFHPATKKVKEITGIVQGIKLKFIDTPGLLPSSVDQRHNEKIMSSVKRFMKKSPPDIMLYFDRLDMPSRDYGDLPLLRTITDAFGAAVWFNAIVVLTHASSAPPDNVNGVPLSYEMFVAQRSHAVQQTIRQAAGDMRLMNPVSLVENHSACRTNRAGQKVLPNGQLWKPQLLLLCFASKILAEANSLLKLQDNSLGRPFGVRSRVPPLPFLLSSLLQSRNRPKLPEEQMLDGDESGEDIEEGLESDDDEEYDELPPFRRLTKDELALLDKEQRKAYFEELDYREKLFQKKQWKEELIHQREMRKGIGSSSRAEQEEDPEEKSPVVSVPMPDMALPPSFDSDNPSYRYRYLESANQWLVRPVLETHGWDHDSGYEGLNLEKSFAICQNVPISISGQITKDKKEANVQMECAASLKHGEGKVAVVGLDLQTVGKDPAYTLRCEARFRNFKRNTTTGGLVFTFLGDTISTGMKIEDRLTVGRMLEFVLNGGAIMGRRDLAYGANLEATLRDKDYPLGRALSTLGVSVMDWHGNLAIGGNMQSQFTLGKTTVIARANLNNRGAGQLSIRASSSEQLQMALIGIIPVLRALLGRLFLSSSQSI